MEVVLVTGMLAAGKSIALRSFQDLGYYCIDNLPPSMIKSFIELAKNTDPPITKVALVVDVRLEGFIDDLDEAITYLKNNVDFRMLFINADDEILISRYKLNRRRHLMFDDDRIEQTIARERSIMDRFMGNADFVLDTSKTSEAEFKAEFMEIFADGDYISKMRINIVSFGYKYGLPKDCDMVFDVRFLPNPYYIPNLKPMSGKDKEISDYVFSFDESNKFLRSTVRMFKFLIPYYIREGKSQLVVGIGCSGGRHRSVAFAEKFKMSMSEVYPYVILEHRDIKKEKYIRGLD